MAKTLLQEAIAEAKQVREAAIRNATKQLEENLTPSIKEALAQKLEEEVELDENEEESLEEATNAGFTEVKPKKQVKEAEEEPKEDGEEEEKPEEGSEESEEGDGEKSEEEPRGENPEGEEKPEGEEEGSEDDDDKKLSDITIGELKDIIQDMVAVSAVPAPEGNEGVDVTPGDVEGAGEEAPLGDLETAAGTEAAAGEEGAEETPTGEEDADPDEEIDLSEILKELEEEDSKLQEEDTAGTLKDPKPQAARRPGNTQSRQNQDDTELQEAYKTIKQLKDTLSEVNLLNSKLVYTTRMLKRNLTESQKAEVIKAFDKAKSPKEVKVIFGTLQESIKPAKRSPLIEARRKSFASRSAGRSTAAQTIVESNDMVRRFQQLAGIID